MDVPNRQNTFSTEGAEEPIPPQLERVSAVLERCLASVLPRYIERHEAKYGPQETPPRDATEREPQAHGRH